MLACNACGESGSTGPVFQVRCPCGGLFRWDVSGAPSSRSRVTPMWEEPGTGRLWKREDLNPTGSYKDRGAEALIEVAREVGAKELVLDSSGGAALAGARVAAREGLPLTVDSPAAVPPRRRLTLELLGARVRAQGTREDAALRAQESAPTAFWFSHVFHPAFSWGVSGLVEELAEQLAGFPQTWYVPVGNGSLLLGLHQGLRRLGRAPRLVAVQPEACSGLKHPGATGASRAGGLAISSPPRREEILAALENPERDVVTVSEEAIADSETLLARRGVLADPAAAAVHAAMEAHGEQGRVLGVLSGAGSR